MTGVAENQTAPASNVSAAKSAVVSMVTLTFGLPITDAQGKRAAARFPPQSPAPETAVEPLDGPNLTPPAQPVEVPRPAPRPDLPIPTEIPAPQQPNDPGVPARPLPTQA